MKSQKNKKRHLDSKNLDFQTEKKLKTRTGNSIPQTQSSKSTELKVNTEDKDYLEQFSRWKYELRKHGTDVASVNQAIVLKHYSENPIPYIIMTAVPNRVWDTNGGYFDPFAAEKNFKDRNGIKTEGLFYVINNYNNAHWDCSYRTNQYKITASYDQNACGAYTLVNIIHHSPYFINLLSVKNIKVRLLGEKLTSETKVNEVPAVEVREFVSTAIENDWNDTIDSKLKKQGVKLENIQTSLSRIKTPFEFLKDQDIYYVAIALGINTYQVQTFRAEIPDFNLIKQNTKNNLSQNSKRNRLKHYQQEYEELQQFCNEKKLDFQLTLQDITKESTDDQEEKNQEIQFTKFDEILDRIVTIEEISLKEILAKKSILNITIKYIKPSLYFVFDNIKNCHSLIHEKLKPDLINLFSSRTKVNQIEFTQQGNQLIVSAIKTENKKREKISLMQILTAEDIDVCLKKISKLMLKDNKEDDLKNQENGKSYNLIESDPLSMSNPSSILVSFKAQVRRNREKATKMMKENYEENILHYVDVDQLKEAELEDKTITKKHWHREYQIPYYQAYIEKRVENAGNPTDVVLPVFTSFGKTFFMIKIAQFEWKAGNSVLFVFPYIALSDQFERDCQKFTLSCALKKIQNKNLMTDSKKKIDELVWFRKTAIYRTVAKGLENLYDDCKDKKINFPFYKFSIIFLDEAHHYGTLKWQEMIKQARKQGCAVMSATATPYALGNGKNLSPYQLIGLNEENNLLPLMDIQDAIEDQLVPPIQFVDIHIKYNQSLPSVKGDDVRFKIKASYIARIIFESVDPFSKEPLWKYQWMIFTADKSLNQLISQEIQKMASSKKYKMMIDKIKQYHWQQYYKRKGSHTKISEDAFIKQFQLVEIIDSTGNPKTSKQKIDKYKERKIWVFINPRMLSEGFDHSYTKNIIIANNACSKVQLLQQLGRGTRSIPGCSTLTYCFQIREHDRLNSKLVREMLQEYHLKREYKLQLFKTDKESKAFCIENKFEHGKKVHSFGLYKNNRNLYVYGKNRNNSQIAHLKLLQLPTGKITNNFIQSNKLKLLNKIKAELGYETSEYVSDNIFQRGNLNNFIKVYANAAYVQKLIKLIFNNQNDDKDKYPATFDTCQQKLCLVIIILSYLDSFMDCTVSYSSQKDLKEEGIDIDEIDFESLPDEEALNLATIKLKYESQPLNLTTLRTKERKSLFISELHEWDGEAGSQPTDPISTLIRRGFYSFEKFNNFINEFFLFVKQLNPVEHVTIIRGIELILQKEKIKLNRTKSKKKKKSALPEVDHSDLTEAIDLELQQSDKGVELLKQIKSYMSFQVECNRQENKRSKKEKKRKKSSKKDKTQLINELMGCARQLNFLLVQLANPFQSFQSLNLGNTLRDRMQSISLDYKKIDKEFSDFICELKKLSFSLQNSSKEFFNYLLSTYNVEWPGFLDWVYVLFFSQFRPDKSTTIKVSQKLLFPGKLLDVGANFCNTGATTLSAILADINQWFLSHFVFKLKVEKDNKKLISDEDDDKGNNKFLIIKQKLTNQTSSESENVYSYSVVCNDHGDNYSIPIRSNIYKDLIIQLNQYSHDQVIDVLKIKGLLLKIILMHQDSNFVFLSDEAQKKIVNNRFSHGESIILFKMKNETYMYEYLNSNQYWKRTQINASLFKSISFNPQDKYQKLTQEATREIFQKKYHYLFYKAIHLLKPLLELAYLVFRNSIRVAAKNSKNLNPVIAVSYNGKDVVGNFINLLCQKDFLYFPNFKRDKNKKIYYDNMDVLADLLSIIKANSKKALNESKADSFSINSTLIVNKFCHLTCLIQMFYYFFSKTNNLDHFNYNSFCIFNLNSILLLLEHNPRLTDSVPLKRLYPVKSDEKKLDFHPETCDLWVYVLAGIQCLIETSYSINKSSLKSTNKDDSETATKFDSLYFLLYLFIILLPSFNEKIDTSLDRENLNKLIMSVFTLILKNTYPAIQEVPEINFLQPINFALSLRSGKDSSVIAKNNIFFHLVIDAYRYLEMGDSNILERTFSLVRTKVPELHESFIFAIDCLGRNCLQHFIYQIDPVKDKRGFSALIFNIRLFFQNKQSAIKAFITHIDIEGDNLFLLHFEIYNKRRNYAKSILFLIKEVSILIRDELITMLLYKNPKKKDALPFIKEILKMLDDEQLALFLAGILQYNFSKSKFSVLKEIEELLSVINTRYSTMDQALKMINPIEEQLKITPERKDKSQIIKDINICLKLYNNGLTFITAASPPYLNNLKIMIKVCKDKKDIDEFKGENLSIKLKDFERKLLELEKWKKEFTKNKESYSDRIKKLNKVEQKISAELNKPFCISSSYSQGYTQEGKVYHSKESIYINGKLMTDSEKRHLESLSSSDKKLKDTPPNAEPDSDADVNRNSVRKPSSKLKRKHYSHFIPKLHPEDVKFNQNVFFKKNKLDSKSDEKKGSTPTKSQPKKRKPHTSLTDEEKYEIGYCGEHTVYNGLIDKYKQKYSKNCKLSEYNYIDLLETFEIRSSVTIDSEAANKTQDKLPLKTIVLQKNAKDICARWSDVETREVREKNIPLLAFNDQEIKTMFVDQRKTVISCPELLSKIKRLCDSSHVTEISGETTEGIHGFIKLIWHNALQESWNSEDLLIKKLKVKPNEPVSAVIQYDSNKDRHIEVKATRSTKKNFATFSQNQLKAMLTYSNRYFIYRVYNVGKVHADEPVNIRKIQDAQTEIGVKQGQEEVHGITVKI